MGYQVCAGGTAMCTYGSAPATLAVLPTNKVMATAVAANVADYIATTNIPTFGSCSSSLNPTVAAATAAAGGTLTPMVCVPVPAAPWTTGSLTVLLGGLSALDSTATCTCSWGGVISILTPGQTTVIDG